MKNSHLCWVALLFLWLAVDAGASGSAIERLKGFLASTRSMKADFSQVSVDEQGGATRKSSGVFYLERPGRFRWNYEHPYRQEIVSDGEKVWFYDADLEQVTVRPLGAALGSTPALLLSGEVSLEANFTFGEQGEFEGLYWVKLLPREEDSGFRYILIGMDGEVLGGMELKDNFGQLTRIYFSDIELNRALDPSLFEFVAPAGVDVFEEG